MAKLNLGYTEGMNQDMGFDKRTPNQYYDAMNIKIVNNGHNFCITNANGEHEIDIPVIINDGQRGIIGQAKITNGVILFVEGQIISRVVSGTTYYEYGYFAVPITDNDEELKVWDASPLFVSSESTGPNEHIGSNIDFVSIVEGNKDKIYFVDGENQMRIITISRDSNGRPVVEEIEDATPKNIDLMPFINDNILSFSGGLSLITGTSKLGYGEYQYFLVASTENGVTSNPSFLSDKITINKLNAGNKQIKIIVNFNNEEISNSIIVYLYRVKYLNEDISIQLIERQKINNNLSKIEFIDDGYKLLQEVSLEEFNSLFKTLSIPKTISSIYNRLVLANYSSYKNFEFLKNYDTRIYSYILDYTSDDVESNSYQKKEGIYKESKSSSDITLTINPNIPFTQNDYNSVPLESNCIFDKSDYKLYKEVYNDEDNNIVLGAAGKNFELKVSSIKEGENSSTLFTTSYFVAGETYRFGVIFYDEYNTASPVKWLCDYTFPEYNPLDITGPNNEQRYFKHTLYTAYLKLLKTDSSDFNLLEKNNIKYFDVCYVKRIPENSNIVDFAICVPGFENYEAERKNKDDLFGVKNPTFSAADKTGSIPLYEKENNFIIDNDFTLKESNNISLPYQIMKDIIFDFNSDGKDLTDKYGVRTRIESGGEVTVYNNRFYLRGGRLQVDNDYGFDWDAGYNETYDENNYIKVPYKIPVITSISYFYSPLISLGYTTNFTSLKPYTILKNDTLENQVFYNKTYIYGSPYYYKQGQKGEMIYRSGYAYDSVTKEGDIGPIFPYRTGWMDPANKEPKNPIFSSGDMSIASFNGMDPGTFRSGTTTCTLFCPRSNDSPEWDKTDVLKNYQQPNNYGYQSSYFVRQYFADYNDENIFKCKMYRSDYNNDDQYLYTPAFIQYEKDGDFRLYSDLRVSNAGKLADFYPVPWSKNVSKDSLSEIQYMQMDCHYSNTIATSFSYRFATVLDMLLDRTKTTNPEPAVELRKRYQILFQLRNDLENQYGGDTYYNKISNSYIVCTARPITIENGNNEPLVFGINGDMIYGSFTIPRVWCNNDGGDDLPITNLNAGILRHNEFVTLTNIPMRVTDYNRNDLFTTPSNTPDASRKYIQSESYDSFCKSSIKYDEQEVLNVSSSIYDNLEVKEYYPIDYNKLITYYPTTLYASNVKIYEEEIDNWSIFPANERIDLDGSYGQVIKLINHNGKLYAFQETGVAFISVQPRVMVNTNDNIDIQLGTGQYFDRYEMLSTNSGISHLNAVSGGYDNLYYIDSNKNALFNLMNGNEEVSLSKGMFKYFNDNTTKGARCYYDLKERRLYVFLDESNEIGLHNSIIYHEVLNGFESRTSIYPVEIFNINDHTLSYYKNEHNIGYSNLFELKEEFNLTTYPFIQFLVNPNGNNYIRYDVVEYTQQNLDEYRKSNVNLFNIKNYYQNATAEGDNLNIKNKFSIFRINVPRDQNIDEYNRKGLRRIFSPQAFIKLQFDGTNHITSNLNLNFY